MTADKEYIFIITFHYIPTPGHILSQFSEALTCVNPRVDKRPVQRYCEISRSIRFTQDA
jgi:hypothetical protein